MSLTRLTTRIAALIWICTSLKCSILQEALHKPSSESQVVTELKRIIRTSAVYQTAPTSEGMQRTLQQQILSQDIRLYPQRYRQVSQESVSLTPLSTWMPTPTSPSTLSGPTNTGTVGRTIKLKPDH